MPDRTQQTRTSLKYLCSGLPVDMMNQHGPCHALGQTLGHQFGQTGMACGQMFGGTHTSGYAAGRGHTPPGLHTPPRHHTPPGHHTPSPGHHTPSPGHTVLHTPLGHMSGCFTNVAGTIWSPTGPASSCPTSHAMGHPSALKWPQPGPYLMGHAAPCHPGFLAGV